MRMKNLVSASIACTLLAPLCLANASTPQNAESHKKEIHAVVEMGAGKSKVTYYDTLEEATVAREKELDEQNKRTIENRKKRGIQRKEQIISSMKKESPRPPVEKTAEIQSAMYSSFLGTTFDLHMVEVYTADYDTIKSGQPYVYAEYVDTNYAHIAAGKEKQLVIFAPAVITTFRKDENKSFGLDAYLYFINEETKEISLARSADMVGVKDVSGFDKDRTKLFELPSHKLEVSDDNYKMGKILYEKLTKKKL